MIDFRAFPRLTPSNHQVTSTPATDYNCIAWSVGDTDNWWQPGVFWPLPVLAGDYGMGVLEQLFRSLGYEDSGSDTNLEAGFEKVALYGSGLFYTHAARQLSNGKWTSKLGKEDDIEHDTPEDVAGGVYGEMVQVMKRTVAGVG